MLITKILALLTLVSWLAATGERLYDCWLSDTSPSTHIEPSKTERWGFGQLRW